jgi:hypothetical protein
MKKVFLFLLVISTLSLASDKVDYNNYLDIPKDKIPPQHKNCKEPHKILTKALITLSPTKEFKTKRKWAIKEYLKYKCQDENGDIEFMRGRLLMHPPKRAVY